MRAYLVKQFHLPGPVGWWPIEMTHLGWAWELLSQSQNLKRLRSSLQHFMIFMKHEIWIEMRTDKTRQDVCNEMIWKWTFNHWTWNRMWNYMNFGSPSDTFLPRIPQIQRLAEENFQKVFMEAQEAITDRSRDSWTMLNWFILIDGCELWVSLHFGNW